MTDRATDEILNRFYPVTGEPTMTHLAHDKDPEGAKHFPTWIDADEARIANKLFSAILRHPLELQVRIFDGEENATNWTRKRADLKAATAQTEFTILQLRKPNGERLGSITLIHGNGPDLISNASAGTDADLDIIETICDEVEA